MPKTRLYGLVVNHNGRFYKLIAVRVAQIILTLTSKICPSNKFRNSKIKMLQKLSLSHNDFIKILKRCRQKKIKFLSSPFNI